MERPRRNAGRPQRYQEDDILGLGHVVRSRSGSSRSGSSSQNSNNSQRAREGRRQAQNFLNLQAPPPEQPQRPAARIQPLPRAEPPPPPLQPPPALQRPPLPPPRAHRGRREGIPPRVRFEREVFVVGYTPNTVIVCSSEDVDGEIVPQSEVYGLRHYFTLHTYFDTRIEAMNFAREMGEFRRAMVTYKDDEENVQTIFPQAPHDDARLQIIRDEMNTLAAGIRRETAETLQRFSVTILNRIQNQPQQLQQQQNQPQQLQQQQNQPQQLQPQQLQQQQLQQQQLQQQPIQPQQQQIQPPQNEIPEGEPTYTFGINRHQIAQFREEFRNNDSRQVLISRLIDAIFTHSELIKLPIDQNRINECVNLLGIYEGVQNRDGRRDIKNAIVRAVNSKVTVVTNRLRRLANANINTRAAVYLETGTGYTLQRIDGRLFPTNLHEDRFYWPLAPEVQQYPIIRGEDGEAPEYCIYCEPREPNSNYFRYFIIFRDTEERQNLR